MTNQAFAMVPQRAVLDQNLPHAYFRLLAVLAAYRNSKTGWAFPSLETLAADMGYTAGASGQENVRKAIKALKAAGYIEHIAGGGNFPSRYKVILDMPPPSNKQIEEECPLEIRGQPPLNLDGEPPSNLEGLTRRYNQKREQEESESKDFEEFWHRYPKKDGKKPALAKFIMARRKFTHQVIMAGLEAHLPVLCRREPQYIPHAATWLHQERFNDPAPPPPRGANGFHAMLQERTGRIQAVHQSKPNRFLPVGQK